MVAFDDDLEPRVSLVAAGANFLGAFGDVEAPPPLVGSQHRLGASRAGELRELVEPPRRTPGVELETLPANPTDGRCGGRTVGALHDGARCIAQNLLGRLLGAGVRVVSGVVMMVAAVPVATAGSGGLAVGDDVEQLQRNSPSLERAHESLRRKESARPTPERFDLRLGREVGAAGQQNVGRVDLVLDFLARRRSSANRCGSRRHTTERTSTASRMPGRLSVSRIPDNAASPVGSISRRSGGRCSSITSDTSNMIPALQQMQPPATSRISTPFLDPGSAPDPIKAASNPTSPYSLTSTAHRSPSGR